jgi:hypothetical protein
MAFYWLILNFRRLFCKMTSAEIVMGTTMTDLPIDYSMALDLVCDCQCAKFSCVLCYTLFWSENLGCLSLVGMSNS